MSATYGTEFSMMPIEMTDSDVRIDSFSEWEDGGEGMAQLCWCRVDEMWAASQT